MGLADLKKKLDLLLALNKAWGAIEEGNKMGRLKPVIFGLIGAVATGIAGAFFGACPDLKAQGAVILVAFVGAAITTWMVRPKEGLHLKAFISAGLSAGVAAVLVHVSSICPGLVAQAPQLVMAGLTTGLTLYVRSHREA